jgi:hypothetical protein
MLQYPSNLALQRVKVSCEAITTDEIFHSRSVGYLTVALDWLNGYVHEVYHAVVDDWFSVTAKRSLGWCWNGSENDRACDAYVPTW